VIALCILAYLVIGVVVARGWYTYWKLRGDSERLTPKRRDSYTSQHADFCIIVGLFWVFIPFALVIAAFATWIVYPVFRWVFKVTDLLVNRLLKPAPDA